MGASKPVWVEISLVGYNEMLSMYVHCRFDDKTKKLKAVDNGVIYMWKFLSPSLCTLPNKKTEQICIKKVMGAPKINQ